MLAVNLLEELQGDFFMDVQVGDVNSGIAVSDDVSGSGYFFYSDQDVHQRFANIATDNADHLIATRLDGAQWQYNDDTLDATDLRSPGSRKWPDGFQNLRRRRNSISA